VVEYRDVSIFPFPRERVWELWEAHWDDARISQIHPLVRSQRTLSRSSNEILVERTIDARGKLLKSQWKYTVRAPDFVRYDIVSGDGPYAPGAFVETQYSEVPGGTQLQTHAQGRITVLPFFLPQKLFFQKVLADVDKEDEAFLKR
jgi:hypothetical protein